MGRHRSRRQYRGDSGSLELLLDTITNAFGGIVFLAILIVVLLQTTTADIEIQPEYDPQQNAVATGHLLDLHSEIEELELQLKLLDTFVSELSDPQLVAMLDELENQKSIQQTLESEKSKMLSQLEKIQKTTSRIQQEHASLDSHLTEVTETVESLKKEFDRERERRTVKTSFPEERSTSKRAYIVAMRYGRWYVVRDSDGTLNDDLLDNAVIVTLINPKPDLGTPATSGNRLSARVVQNLNGINPQTEYVDIAIWDDSYREFQPLRDHIVKHGLNYRLLVVDDNTPPTYGTGVETPRVQ